MAEICLKKKMTEVSGSNNLDVALRKQVEKTVIQICNWHDFWAFLELKLCDMENATFSIPCDIIVTTCFIFLKNPYFKIF